MNDEYSELAPAEKELLRDIAAFNAKFAATGWHIRNKAVQENLSRILLYNSSVTSSRMLDVNLETAQLTNSQFTSVEFEQAEFINASLRGVVFTDCNFADCSFEKSRLTDCRFINCHAKDLNATGATFQGCVFESFEDSRGLFNSGSIKDCRWERCKLAYSSFQAAEIVSLSLRQSALRNVTFAGLRGKDLQVEDCALEHCGFSDSQYSPLALQRCTIKIVTFDAFNGLNITIQNCSSIGALTILDSRWEQSTIADCPRISELRMIGCGMKDLSIARSRIAYFDLKGTQVLGKSGISLCQIAGLSLAGSNVSRLQMANCHLEKYLILDGATFDGLVLTNISYGQLNKVSATGVKYVNGSAEFAVR